MRGSWTQSIVLTVLLFAAWLLWSGVYEPLLLSFGAASSIATAALIRRMEKSAGSAEAYRLGPRLVFYLPWLLGQLVKANLQVAREVLRPRLGVRPSVFRVEAPQRSDLGKVIYANSITITPGTLSIEVRDGKILVHALTREAADDLRSGEMSARVCRLEGEA